LPVEAVQFHPESLLSQSNECGLRMIENMVRQLGRARRAAAGR
jgi:anthranilate/para-aminobenzoate synthase component II